MLPPGDSPEPVPEEPLEDWAAAAAEAEGEPCGPADLRTRGVMCVRLAPTEGDTAAAIVVASAKLSVSSAPLERRVDWWQEALEVG